MRLVKSNEPERGCKTKPTNKLTNKTNVQQMKKISVEVLTQQVRAQDFEKNNTKLVVFWFALKQGIQSRYHSHCFECTH